MIYPHNIQQKIQEKEKMILPGSDMERFKKSVARHVRQMKLAEMKAAQNTFKNIPHIDLAKPSRDYIALWATVAFIIFGGYIAGLVYFIATTTWNITPVAP